MFPTMFPEERTNVTLELRQVAENGVDIWAFDYPSFYQGEEKLAFEQKVLDHFWLRQIGAETVGRFLHYFRRTVREIMPLYIQRYQSVKLMDDPEIRPLENYYMVETFSGSDKGKTSATSEGTRTDTETGTTTGETTSETNGTGTGMKTTSNGDWEAKAISDTPQGQLSAPLAMAGETVNLSYASQLEQNLSKGEGTEKNTATESSTTAATSEDSSERTVNQSEEHSETGTNDMEREHSLTRRGNIGVTTYAQLLEGYRQTFLNIDMEVINELEVCFLGVY